MIIIVIELVYIEFFDGFEGIVDVKVEIFEGMELFGVVVLNVDGNLFDWFKRRV